MKNTAFAHLFLSGLLLLTACDSETPPVQMVSPDAARPMVPQFASDAMFQPVRPATRDASFQNADAMAGPAPGEPYAPRPTR